MTKRLSRCIHCERGFPDHDGLERHLKDLHMGAPNKEARCCISCGEVTAELEEHAHLKHGIKTAEPRNCRVCKKKFTYIGDRNRHEYTHSTIDCEAVGLVRL